jgi:peptide/nickel transport system permease protein
MAATTAAPTSGDPRELSVRWRATHPVLTLVGLRCLAGIGTLFIVSIVVFAATEVLPGNAAVAILGNTATPARVHLLEHQLGLDRSVFAQYWSWLSGLLSGNLGTSLASGQGVGALVGPRIVNSAVLVFSAGIIGSILGVGIGALAAVRRDGWLDHMSAIAALAVTAVPEFVVAIVLVMIFATLVLNVLPGASVIPPGSYPWDNPKLIVLPVATLVIVIVPYIQRMMRASMIEALDSDYVEMARLKGIPEWRIVLVHGLPNAVPPTIQVIGLCFLYLAGGVVVVEYVFNYPGIGQGLVDAVAARDIPVVQFIVLILAAFYVFMNILTDVIALLATPRRRIAR